MTDPKTVAEFAVDLDNLRATDDGHDPLLVEVDGKRYPVVGVRHWPHGGVYVIETRTDRY